MEVFGYTRISVDLDEDSRENTSIENQKKIITDFVGSTFPDAHLTLFEDRDRSGYTFSQRESYQKMRSRMMSGECTILVVKDFSRFSRRNSLGLLELETLRDAGIRIISIGDGIDYPTKDDWMLIQFKFLMNEMPVTDTSRKIKQIIQSRQKDGKWVCAVPYGYRIINTKAMTYEIDPPAAEVVREIFRLYNNGWGYKKIANYLTDNGVPTPRANELSQKEAAGVPTKIRSSTVWNTATLSGLLANDFYIGTLRQNKYVRKGINGKDQKVGDEEHIVIENAHTPIIDPRTFAYTQEQMKLRTKSNYRGEKKYATDYSGFLFCGDCGSPMFSLSRPDIPAAYTCGTYHRRGLKGCTSHHIRVDTLDDLLKRYLKQVRDNSSAMLEELETAIREQPQREEEIGKTIDSVQAQLAQAKEQLKNTLKRKLLDTMGKPPETAAIIEETYTEIENELTWRIAGLEKQIDAGNTLRNNMLKVNRAAKTVIDVFDDILSKPTLDKRDISFLVERISVYTDHLDVKLKPDIDTLLKLAPDHEDSINFSTDSKDIASTTIVQRSTHRKDKVFTVNVVNEGEVPQYYVEDSHPAIIRPEEWEAVQTEITRRKGKGRRHDCGSPFSGKILCGDCGSVYGSKVWHSNDKYRRVIWQCNSKFKNETKCATPHVDEKILKERFLRALSQYMADPEERVEGLRYVQKSMTNTDFIDADIEKAERDLERLSAMVRNCIMLNASANLTEEAYTQQYTDLTRQYEEKKAEYEALLERKKAMEATAIIFSGILFRLTELEEIPIDFDEALWNTLVDHVTVYADERIVFSFMDGTEIVSRL